MEEARLIHHLRGLPRETASADFTARVLRRLDEPAPPAANRSRRLLLPPRWHRLMVATATVAALGISVGVSVGVLQRERLPLPLAAGLAPAMPLAQRTPGEPAGAAAPAAASLPASPMDRTFRHELSTAELRTPGLGARDAAGRPGGGIAPATAAIGLAQAHQMLRELQLEHGRLERELRSLRRPGSGAPPTVLYLGGDENYDLVLNTGRNRAQSPPLGDRDDGENYNYL